MGEITVPYTRLVELFGSPDGGDGYKTDAEWVLTLPGGIVVTIYNWKNGPAHCGSAGTPVEAIRNWHVGGKKREVLYLLGQIINEAELHKQIRDFAKAEGHAPSFTKKNT